MQAGPVDAAVAGLLLGAISGDELALALAATDEVTARRARFQPGRRTGRGTSRYQAERAERALLAVEPENRLVARTFENRLEARLGEQPRPKRPWPPNGLPSSPSHREPRSKRRWPTSASCGGAQHLAPGPQTALAHPIADITLIPDADLAKVRIGVRWHAGMTEELIVQRPHRVYEDRRTTTDVLALAHGLGRKWTTPPCPGALNTAGHRTATGRAFDAARDAPYVATTSWPHLSCLAPESSAPATLPAASASPSAP